jgi:hypothetical protein
VYDLHWLPRVIAPPTRSPDGLRRLFGSPSRTWARLTGLTGRDLVDRSMAFSNGIASSGRSGDRSPETRAVAAHSPSAGRVPASASAGRAGVFFVELGFCVAPLTRPRAALRPLDLMVSVSRVGRPEVGIAAGESEHDQWSTTFVARNISRDWDEGRQLPAENPPPQ